MLEKFFKAKQKEISALNKLRSLNQFPSPYQGIRPDFINSIKSSSKNPAIIAEFKQASPSRGIICDSLSVEEVTSQYVDNGACALSILTEQDYFNGDLEFISRAHNVQSLASPKPILRKDFIFDPVQVKATAATPAAALLLIVKMFSDPAKLRELLTLAGKYNLQCVVEIFNSDELVIARDCGASIIQVNARDLNTLKTDRAICLNLANSHPPQKNEIWIAASGMEKNEHIKEAREAGYDAVLLGTALMKYGTPGKTLKALLEDEN